MSNLEYKARNTRRGTQGAGGAVFAACLLLFFAACAPTPVPKPRAYMRIALPEKEYIWFNGEEAVSGTQYPFSFRMPVYAEPVAVPPKKEYPNTSWLDIRIPSLHATLYVSHIYRPNLDSCITSTLFFIQRHIPKATGMDEREINEPESRRYGWFYHIKGRDVASPYQFYLTDSAHHFVRGSLYTDGTPNNDSLAPVLNFLKTDLDTILSTWTWR